MTVTISFNQPPVAADKTVTTGEDTAETVTLSASDAEGDDTASFNVNQPANGSLGAVGAVTCDVPTPNACTAERDLHARRRLQRA